MRINLLTDAPKHNLALMKLSAWHKANGDDVMLFIYKEKDDSTLPIFKADHTYASILFEKNINKFEADEYGGPAIENSVLPEEVERMTPDYSLYNLNYSLGYTWRPCYNTCEFCKVPKMNHPISDTTHESIWDFHIEEHNTICLLNNNTFQDPYWKDTFKEIWDEDLSVIDENGYDLRLLDDERADALRRTRFVNREGKPGSLHFAWDRMQDEQLIINGLRLLNRHKLRSTSNGVYILIGYDTTEKEDLYRCQMVHDFGLTPYPMPYIKTDYTKQFKRFCNLHYYRQEWTIEKAWKKYAA